MENTPRTDTRVLLAASNPDLARDGEPAPRPSAADRLRGLDLLMAIASESGDGALVDWYLDRRNEAARDD